jgi:hypothetical protein
MSHCGMIEGCMLAVVGASRDAPTNHIQHTALNHVTMPLRHN